MNNKIFIMRHGQSIGNENRIIQGISDGYELTNQGEKEISHCANENVDRLGAVQCIFSSDLKRAKQTAEIVRECIGCISEVVPLEVIREMNPGELSDVTHEEAARLLPHSYSIWIKRGDLDGIRGAEKGDELQARVVASICFFSRIECRGDVLIVSHAGFIRCFVNTILNRSRNTAVDVSNACLHELSFLDINDKICTLKESNSKCVYVYDAYEREYVVKRYTLDRVREIETVISLYKRVKSPFLPTVLYEGVIWNYYFVVMQRCGNKHVHGELGSDRILRAWNCFEKIEEEVIDCLNGQACETLFHRIQRYNEYEQDPSIKYAGQFLCEKLKDMSVKMDSIVLYDLHRDNCVELQNGEWILVDYDGLLHAPCEFFLASFLAAFVWLEDQLVDIQKLLYYLNASRYSERIVIELILYRLHIGLVYFDESNHSKDILYRRYYDSIMNWEIYIEHHQKQLHEEYLVYFDAIRPKW